MLDTDRRNRETFRSRLIYHAKSFKVVSVTRLNNTRIGLPIGSWSNRLSQCNHFRAGSNQPSNAGSIRFYPSGIPKDIYRLNAREMDAPCLFGRYFIRNQESENGKVTIEISRISFYENGTPKRVELKYSRALRFKLDKSRPEVIEISSKVIDFDKNQHPKAGS